MKKIIRHSGGMLCVIACIAVWWYFIYEPLCKNYKASVQTGASFIEQEPIEFITSSSLISSLLYDAEQAGLMVVGCVSGEAENTPVVSVQVQAKSAAAIMQFLAFVTDHLPSVCCTHITFKKTETLEVDMRFVSLPQLVQETIIAPDFLSRDPFCDGGCRVIAHGCCTDLGFTFHVKKQGDHVFIERLKK